MFCCRLCRLIPVLNHVAGRDVSKCVVKFRLTYYHCLWIWRRSFAGQRALVYVVCSVHAAVNKSLQATKLITAFLEVSCKLTWVPLMGVTGQVTVCRLSSALAAFGFVDLEISGFCE